MGLWAFLFTDLEGSTWRWEQATEAMRGALERHHELLRDAVEAHGGRVLSDMGDGIAAAFSSPTGAVIAATEAQLAMTSETWLGVEPLRARMALHAGEAFEHGAELRGPTLNRCARLMAAAHGGQLVCTSAFAELVSDGLPGGVGLRDLGEHRLRDLARPEHVFEVQVGGVPSDFPPLRTLESSRTNLPRHLSSFVGRHDEIIEICSLLEESRLVSLVGAGGIGKTRLALQVAAEQLEEFPDGVWLVELAPLSDPGSVVTTVAGALSVTPEGGRTMEQAVYDFLRRKEILIVLDNCEHLLDAAVAFIDSTEKVAPGVRVLATSREALGVTGEHVVRVEPLGVPDVGVSDVTEAASSSAFELFRDRARGSRAGSSSDSREAVEAIGEICRRLDGMPLAIELAAARMSSMTAQEITEHLDHRLQLLSRRRGSDDDRHRTLRATIDWSYGLLTGSEQEHLDKLSVFEGSFRADAVAVVAQQDDVASLDVLGALVDKSLVIADLSGAATQYRLLETIREYGSQRLADLGTSGVVRDRHLAFYVQFARHVEERVGFAGDDPMRARVDAELENIRAAVDWALETGRTDTAVELVGRLHSLYLPLRAKSEVFRLAVRLSSIDGFTNAPYAAQVLYAAISELGARGSQESQALLMRRAGEILLDTPANRFSMAQAQLAHAYATGDRSSADRAVQAILSAVDELDDDRVLTYGHGRAALHAVPTDSQQAWSHAQIAVAAARRAGSSSGAGLAFALLGLALALDAREQHDDAFAALQEAVAVTETSEIWSASEWLAGHYVRRQQYPEAALLYHDLLEHHRTLGHHGRAADVCAPLADFFVEVERDRDALLIEAVLAREEHPALKQPFLAASLERARTRTQREDQHGASTSAAAMTLEELVDHVLAELRSIAAGPLTA